MTQHAFISVLALFAAVAGAQAGETGPHPALRSTASAASFDASALMIGHPAGGRAGRVPRSRANEEHPAVISARLATKARLDPNAYLVQPPATTRWTQGPAVENAATQLANR